MMKTAYQRAYVILYFVLMAGVLAMIFYPVFAHPKQGGGPESLRIAAAHRREQHR
jgi:hypothetical protein